MRLHRFYIQHTIGEQKEVEINSPELIHQLRSVFRLKQNDQVILFDGSGFDYVCTIGDSEKSKTSLKVNINSVSKSRWVPERNLYLYAAIPKKDTFEWIVEKATELGVTHVVPVISERTEKKSVNAERLMKISTEAAEQSGRGSILEIEKEVTLTEALGNVRSAEAKVIAFHTEGDALMKKDFLNEHGARVDLACFIGPEGGWSPKEIDMFHAHNIPVRVLGPQVLRAETAVIATLSLVVFGPK